MPLFIAAGISAAGSIGSAYLSSQATSNAAKATTGAANTATAEASRQFDIGQRNQQPWLTTGGSALNKLAGLYGLDTFTQAPPTATPGAAQTPGMTAALSATGGRGGAGMDWGQAALTGGLSARSNNSPIQDISQAINDGRPVTDAQWQQAGYGPGGAQASPTATPGAAAPTMAQMNPTAGTAPGGQPVAPGGGFTPGSSQPGVDPNASFYQSPDYAFRLSQGIGALDAGAASRGALDSGATRKAEIKFGSNIAAGGFNDYANRLAALAGVGQTTATNTANQGAAYAGQVGANARWAGDNLATSYQANGQNYGTAVSKLAGIGSGLIQNQPSGVGVPNQYGTQTSPGYVDWGF